MTIRVLAVDNNPVLLKAISTILTQEGCKVREAETGLDALEQLDQFIPDILFTDLIMPRVSGEQLCRVVRSSKKYENVFIVVLSAIVLEDRDRILEEVDCDLCIAKGNLKEIRVQLKNALKAYGNRMSEVDRNTNSTLILLQSSFVVGMSRLIISRQLIVSGALQLIIGANLFSINT